MTSSTRPRVSIGMPVYNGERYVAEAICSILTQTFEDFELIISDNASTDRTARICGEFARRDNRIRYYRNPENLGANQNFNRTLELASGDYFMWAACDDLRAREFVERAVRILDNDPGVVIVFSQTTVIDELGNPISADAGSRLRTDSPLPHVRFYDLQRTPHECFQVLGLMRASALKKTKGLGLYSSADYALLAEMGLFGRFYEIREPLIFYRHHSQQSIQLDRHERMAWSGSRKGLFPQWRLYLALWACTFRVPLAWSARVQCFATMLRWPFWYRNWRRLGKDAILACPVICAAAIRPLYNIRSARVREVAGRRNA